MIKAADLKSFGDKTKLWDDDTETLKRECAQLRHERSPLYLNKDEFDRILQWKLGSQYGRQRAKRTGNTDTIIRQVTQSALSLENPDDTEYEMELRVNLLCSLRGVGVPVASAILTMLFPERYAVIDFRVWRQCFGEERTTFSVGDYRRYMARIRQMAAELDWPTQKVDRAIWQYDKE